MKIVIAPIFRTCLKLSDASTIKSLVKATGFFRDCEIDIAEELIVTQLANSNAGYRFVFTEVDNLVIGYACWGKTPCTESTWDLYWVAVHPNYSNKGLGKVILNFVENDIRLSGGKSLIAETSSLNKYSSTRIFYERCNYRIASVVSDFYDNGDDKIIFRKFLD
jgi:ribosomal protein S18 acetylase RimI-like enzyme